MANISCHTVPTLPLPPLDASCATTSVPGDNAPAQDPVLDESANVNAANGDAADDHSAASGDDLVTGNGASVDSAGSDDVAADKWDNASEKGVDPTPGAWYWRAPGTTTMIRLGIRQKRKCIGWLDLLLLIRGWGAGWSAGRSAGKLEQRLKRI